MSSQQPPRGKERWPDERSGPHFPYNKIKIVEARTLKFIAEGCGGELVSGSSNRMVTRVCTDSRMVQEGDLFIALAGEKFDAHSFIPQVIEKGAAAVVIEKERTVPNTKDCGVIAVDNTRRALGQLATTYRNDFDIPFIAVGGSNGKTTTKELIASVLRQKLPTLWSEASFNNDIGVPLTLMRLDRTHKAAVLEVGTNHPGELPPLLHMIRPRHSVITSIGREHLEFFGSMDGVVREEGSLAEFLPANGRLFVNGESEWVKPIAKRCRASVVKVGRVANLSEIWGKAWSKEKHFCARNVRMSERGISFSVVTADEEFGGDYHTPLLGRHQVVNALLAIAVGAELGLTQRDIQQGLAECKPARMRMELWSAGGVQVLDDCYNANADSMLSALETLAEFPTQGRRIAVLGDMAELGAFTEESHQEVGRRAGELKLSHLISVGKMAQVTTAAARAAGLKTVETFKTVSEAGEALKVLVKPGDTVLLKASRAMKLETIADFLKGHH